MSPDIEVEGNVASLNGLEAMAARSLDTADRGGQPGGEVDRSRADGWDIRYRLDVVAHSVLEVVSHAGGWLLEARDHRRRPQALAVATDLFGSDLRVPRGVLNARLHRQCQASSTLSECGSRRVATRPRPAQ
jgi:hypothetical protein